MMLLSMGFAEGGVGFGLEEVTPANYLMSQAGVLLHYLKLSFWPWPLCFDYKAWPLTTRLADCWREGLVILALLVGTVWAWWRRPWLGFLGAWFFLILAPTSSFMPLVDLAFEHRMYLPLAAVVAVAVAAGYAALTRLGAVLAIPPRLQTPGLAALVAGLAVTLGTLTFLRNEAYRSTEAMWADVLARQPENFRALINLGTICRAEGRVAEAEDHFREARRVASHLDTPHAHLVELALERGELGPALERLEEALGRLPDLPYMHCLLGLIRLELGQQSEALSSLEQALMTRPQLWAVHYFYAVGLLRVGRTEEAVIQGRILRYQNPPWAKRSTGEARNLVLQENPSEWDVRQAILRAETVCFACEEAEASHWDTLGMAYALAGWYPEAATAANRALELATASGQDLLAEAIRRRLTLYQQGRAFRYPPTKVHDVTRRGA
jgi:Flp pilus assembly protein TadD